MKNSVFQEHNQRVRRRVPVPLTSGAGASYTVASGAGASYTVASIGFVHTKPQSVEKVQLRLGFLLYLWYNRYGDGNVGKERK